MKTRSTLLILVAAALVAIPAIILAGGFGPAAGGSGPGHGPGRGFAMAGRLLAQLDLTADQRAKVDAIRAETKPQVRALFDQVRQGREAFAAAHQPGTFDEQAARTFADGQAKIHAEIIVLELRTFARIAAVLTPEQLQKAKDLRAAFRERHGAPGF